jgi:hypothetical protein
MGKTREIFVGKYNIQMIGKPMRTMDFEARNAEVINRLTKEEMRPILVCLKSFL